MQALWVDGLGAGPGLWAAPKHLGPPEALVPGPVPWPGLGPAYTLKHETSMERHETSAKRHETSIENLILALLLRIAHFGGGFQINMALETRVFHAPRYRAMFTGSDVKQHAMRQAGQNRKWPYLGSNWPYNHQTWYIGPVGQQINAQGSKNQNGHQNRKWPYLGSYWPFNHQTWYIGPVGQQITAQTLSRLPLTLHPPNLVYRTSRSTNKRSEVQKSKWQP